MKYRLIITALVVVSAAALRGQSGGTRIGPAQTLGLTGASNSAPSLAAAGRNVAAVWTATQNGVSNVYLALSTNGGATFSPPRRVNDRDGEAGATNEQPPRIVLSGAQRAPTLTVLWSQRDLGPQQTRRDIIRMARSTDGGRTFSPARIAHDPAFSGARGWQSLIAAQDGTIHAVWLDGRDAGRRMTEIAKHSGMAHKGQPPQEIYHGMIASDGRIVETPIASDVCFCCKTAVAVDARGAIHTAWRHIFPGSMRDIAFATSTDGGRRFGPLVRVSEDKWELNGCPEDGPSLVVDTSGTIHITWATVVGGAEPEKAIFYATSRDGRVFSARKRVPTTGTTTPGHPQIAVTPIGAIAIVFDEVASGVRRVSLARVSETGTFLPTEIVSAEESASHPVIVAAGSDLVAAWTSRSVSGKPESSQIKVQRISAR